MSVQLKLDKVEGVRYRQQTQREVEGRKEKSWAFEPQDCMPDLDARTHEPLPRFTVFVSSGLQNLVVEKKGAPTTVNFRNSSVRNQLRIRQQNKDKSGKWLNGPDTYVPANSYCGVYVGDSNRAIVDEMPT